VSNEDVFLLVYIFTDLWFHSQFKPLAVVFSSIPHMEHMELEWDLISLALTLGQESAWVLGWDTYIHRLELAQEFINDVMES
jgi:hypothetical protein